MHSSSRGKPVIQPQPASSDSDPVLEAMPILVLRYCPSPPAPQCPCLEPCVCPGSCCALRGSPRPQLWQCPLGTVEGQHSVKFPSFPPAVPGSPWGLPPTTSALDTRQLILRSLGMNSGDIPHTAATAPWQGKKRRKLTKKKKERR